MGTEILIDTNVVKIELLSFNPPNPNDLIVVEQFINKCTVFSLTEGIAEKTYLLRRKHRIKLPDAMIAATALVHNLAIFTRNTSDFNGLEGLTVIDPYNL